MTEPGGGRRDARGASAPSAGVAVEVREVRSAGDRTRFVRCPYPIYAHDPHWVAPLEVEVREFIDPRKHPFLRHGMAAQFIALRDGRPVGRILVSDDPHYNAQHNASVGCFGLFESVDDQQVAHPLLEAAANWIRGRGRSQMMGPVDYSTNYPLGLLVDGFDTPPRVMMNHHPRYYAALLESWGLAKVKDVFGWWFVDPLDLTNRWRSLIERVERRNGVVVRPFRLDDFDADVACCRSIYNAARRDNWGFVKLTDAEFRYLAEQIRRVAKPELVLIAESKGQPVAFSVTLPDVNEAIKPLHGRLTQFGAPIGMLRLLWRLPRVKTARMMVLDVVEEYRRRGIAELLIYRTLHRGMTSGDYTAAELSWTLEDNRLINRAIEAVGGEAYKTYRIYQKTLV